MAETTTTPWAESNAKAPQDHKLPATEIAERKQEDFSEVEGHELMVPFAKVDGIAQARLASRVASVQDFFEEGQGIDPKALDKVADVIEYVADNFTLDKGKFLQFTCGPGGMERAINLVFAYVGELGKDAR